MSEHLVFVDTFRVRPGRLDDFRRVTTEICDLVAAEEPRVLAYTIYVSDDGTEGVGLQVHPDYESVKRHRVVLAPVFARIGEVAEIVRMEIYGNLAAHRLEQIRETTTAFGDVPLISRSFHAGFVRQPAAG